MFGLSVPTVFGRQTLGALSVYLAGQGYLLGMPQALTRADVIRLQL